jgi:hypothetical protein
MGLTQNPFPQLGRAEYQLQEIRLAKLGANPIPEGEAEQYIRGVLKGFSKEFVEYCIAKYEPGKMVKFYVTWKE